MNTTDLRVKRTRHLLSEALKTLMKKMSFDKITITDICEKAMVHRTTFYAHFDDKYDLLRYTMREFEEPFEKVKLKEVSAKGYRNYYMEVAEKVFDYVDDNKELFKILLDKNKHESCLSFFQNSLTESFEEKLKICEKSGIKFDMPTEVISNMYMGGVISVVMWWVEKGAPFSVEDLLKYLEVLIPTINNISSAK